MSDFQVGRRKKLLFGKRWSILDQYMHLVIEYEKDSYADEILLKFDNFIEYRKSFKCYTEDYVHNAVRELGGEVV